MTEMLLTGLERVCQLLEATCIPWLWHPFSILKASNVWPSPHSAISWVLFLCLPLVLNRTFVITLVHRGVHLDKLR